MKGLCGGSSAQCGYLCISLGPLVGWGWGSGQTRYSPSQCSLDRRYTSPRYCKSAGRTGETWGHSPHFFLFTPPPKQPTQPWCCAAVKTNKTWGGTGQCRWTHPVVGADAWGRGARAGAEVEGGDREAAALQTHHVRPTWRPVLHVAQIQAVIQHCVAAPADQTVTLRAWLLYSPRVTGLYLNESFNPPRCQRKELPHLQSRYLFWWWMVRLVSFPCSSPNLGLSVRLVHSSKPHRTSLMDKVRKQWNNDQKKHQNFIYFIYFVKICTCSLTACCTAPIPDHWSPGHSFLSPCPQSLAFHSRTCQLSLRRENRVFFLNDFSLQHAKKSCFNPQTAVQHGELKLNIQSKPTVAPQSPALAISGLTATSITPTLRRRMEMMTKRGKTGRVTGVAATNI